MNYTSIKQSFKKDHYGNKLNPCITCLEGKNQKSTSLNKARFAKYGKTQAFQMKTPSEKKKKHNKTGQIS